MEDSYVIHGGKILKGDVQLSGAKNIALKVIIASLLFDKEVILENIPHIRDIEELISLIQSLGGKAEFIEKNKVVIDSSHISTFKIDLLHATKVRVSFMLFAPLLKKFSQAHIPNPGGCRIGERPIDRNVEVMKSMGVDVNYFSDDGYYHAKTSEVGLYGGDVSMNKPSHTGTEFAIMLGVIAQGETIIDNASLEPEIDDLIRFLNESGADIKRDENIITIQGGKPLSPPPSYKIENDRNEAVTYACLALATKGDITIHGIDPKQLTHFTEKLDEINGGYELLEHGIRVFYKGVLRGTDVVAIPHPGFMTDWQSTWAVLMTQAEGTSIVHETIFENRFAYVKELKKLGANIRFFKPEVEHPEVLYQFNWTPEYTGLQAIKIKGITPLHNGVMNVNDLRAGATLLIAAMIAKGESIVNGASIIERGYENLPEKIKKLGGDIEKV